MPHGRAYLSVCAIYRDEARYLPEWIEFHRMVGVERFYLFDNRSSDDHLEVLAPYIGDGIVLWRDWPMFPGQSEAYQRCIEDHGGESRWIAFIDLDEFLFSPTGVGLPEVLRKFEAHPAVAVNRIFYGTSGHESPPPGLVVENYTRRNALGAPRNRIVKSVVDPAHFKSLSPVPHFFHYLDGRRAVDENCASVKGQETQGVSVERLRINHYFTRSLAERRVKIMRPQAHSGRLVNRPHEAEQRDRPLNDEADEILVPYGRAVRKALAARGAGRPHPR